MLSIDHNIQRWQRRELEARQQSVADFHLLSTAALILVSGSLIIAGLVCGLIEANLLKTRASAGLYLFVSGLAALASLVLYAVFGDLAVDIYNERTVY